MPNTKSSSVDHMPNWDYKTSQRINNNSYRTSCGKQLGSRPASSTDSIHRVFSVGTKHTSNKAKNNGHLYLVIGCDLRVGRQKLSDNSQWTRGRRGRSGLVYWWSEVNNNTTGINEQTAKAKAKYPMLRLRPKIDGSKSHYTPMHVFLASELLFAGKKLSRML